MRSRRVSPLVVPALVALAFLGAWQVSEIYRIPSFDWETEAIAPPEELATVTVEVRGLKCRHSSLTMQDLLFGREDENRVEGYLRARIFPAPGIGEMELSYDPQRTDLKRLARAVRLDRKGQETPYRMLLEVAPDLSSPAALLHSLARAFEEQNAELFLACHAEGAAAGSVDFMALVGAWGELFLEDLVPGGEVDAQGRVGWQGVIAGERVSPGSLGLEMTGMTLAKTGKGWMVARAEWGKFRAK